MPDLYDEFGLAVDELTERPKPRRGTLGYKVNGKYRIVSLRDNGEDEDPDRYNVFFDDGSWARVLHRNAVEPSEGKPVLVARDFLDDGTEYEYIIGSAPERNAVYEQTIPQVGEVANPNEGTNDAGFILVSHKEDPNTNFLFYVSAGAYFTPSYWWWLGQVIDLAGYIPATSNHHGWAVICIDPSISPHELVVLTTNSQHINIPLDRNKIDDTGFEALGYVGVAAVSLRNGQASGSTSNIVHLWSGYRVAGASGMDSFAITADSGDSLLVQNGSVIDIVGANGIETSITGDILKVAIADGGVDTLQLADDAVTLDKLAGGTVNRFYTTDGSGNPTLSKVVPAGDIVDTSSTQTLTNKTLAAPTIADFTNANHNHQNAAGGGTLALSALTTVGGDANKVIVRNASGSVIASAHLFTDETGDGLLIGTQPDSVTNIGSRYLRVGDNSLVGSATVANGETIIGHANTLTTGDILGALSFYSSDATVDATGRQAAVKGISDNPNGSSAALAFFTGTGAENATVERMRITSSGNVGIGTSDPVGKLSIQALGAGTGEVMETWLNNTGGTRFQFLYDVTNVRYHIANRSGTPLVTVVETNGNVGIGTTPTNRLDVSGNADVTGFMRAGAFIVDADGGAAPASTVEFTNVTGSPSVGSPSGYLKIWVGSNARWIPFYVGT